MAADEQGGGRRGTESDDLPYCLMSMAPSSCMSVMLRLMDNGSESVLAWTRGDPMAPKPRLAHQRKTILLFPAKRASLWYGPSPWIE